MNVCVKIVIATVRMPSSIMSETAERQDRRERQQQPREPHTSHQAAGIDDVPIAVVSDAAKKFQGSNAGQQEERVHVDAARITRRRRDPE